MDCARRSVVRRYDAVSGLWRPSGPAPVSDALVCLFIFRGFREEWEIPVFIAFLCSCFASLLRIGGFVPEPWVYASLLELCNAGALLWITGIGLIDLIGRNENSPVHH